MTAVGLGLDEVKFFPAGLLGGPAAIRALAAPFTDMSFMPSGGVSADEHGRLPRRPRRSRGQRQLDGRPRPAADRRWAEVTARSADAVARAAALA